MKEGKNLETVLELLWQCHSMDECLNGKGLVDHHHDVINGEDIWNSTTPSIDRGSSRSRESVFDKKENSWAERRFHNHGL